MDVPVNFELGERSGVGVHALNQRVIIQLFELESFSDNRVIVPNGSNGAIQRFADCSFETRE
jgi:hypothetical protein